MLLETRLGYVRAWSAPERPEISQVHMRARNDNIEARGTGGPGNGADALAVWTGWAHVDRCELVVVHLRNFLRQQSGWSAIVASERRVVTLRLPEGRRLCSCRAQAVAPSPVPHASRGLPRPVMDEQQPPRGTWGPGNGADALAVWTVWALVVSFESVVVHLRPFLRQP